MGQGRARRLGMYFTASVALILCAHLALPWLAERVWALAVFLLLFFTPFNILEALLPSLTSRLAPPGAKGVAIGVYSSVQFFGTFFGAAAGGYLYGRWGVCGVVIADAVLLVIWLVRGRGMRTPGTLSTRTRDAAAARSNRRSRLVARLRALPGVHEAQVVAAESTAYLKVDSAGFDEHNVLNIIAGKES